VGRGVRAFLEDSDGVGVAFGRVEGVLLALERDFGVACGVEKGLERDLGSFGRVLGVFPSAFLSSWGVLGRSSATGFSFD